MIKSFYDIFDTLNKNGRDKGNVERQEIVKVDKNDYINFEDFITPKNYIERKKDDVMLR